MTEQLLKCYFSTDRFEIRNKYSIGNYVRYYNELRADCLGVQPQRKSKYPNHYDRDFERKLPTQELQYYWAHLRSKGLKPVKRENSSETIDWK